MKPVWKSKKIWTAVVTAAVVAIGPKLGLTDDQILQLTGVGISLLGAIMGADWGKEGAAMAADSAVLAADAAAVAALAAEITSEVAEGEATSDDLTPEVLLEELPRTSRERAADAGESKR